MVGIGVKLTNQSSRSGKDASENAKVDVSEKQICQFAGSELGVRWFAYFLNSFYILLFHANLSPWDKRCT